MAKKSSNATRAKKNVVERAERVSDEDFLAAFAKANSLQDVIDATGLSEATVQQKASYFRTNGVPLKKFERKKKVRDFKMLAEFYKAAEKKK